MSRRSAPESRESIVYVTPIKVTRAVIRLVGDSPLVTHAFSDETMSEMVSKHSGKDAPQRKKKDPFLCFVQSLHWLDRDTGNHIPPPPDLTPDNFRSIASQYDFGISGGAVKSAAIQAAADSARKGLGAKIKRGVHIDAQFIRIQGSLPTLRGPDRVSLGDMKGSTDVRFRAQFDDWLLDVPVRINESVISISEFVDLLNQAGFGVGVGELRPQAKRSTHSGSCGTFHPESYIPLPATKA